MTTELLEREKELAALRALLAAARDGRGGVALIHGASGQGKSALLDALEPGMRVLRATGAALERDFPFGVVRQLVGPATLEAAPDLTLEPTYCALHALHELAVELTAEAPLAILVDDAHFADPGSLKALALLARRVEGLPIALIVASTDEHVLDAPLVLRPQPLSQDAVAQLIAAALERPVAPAFAAAAGETTGGNPLLVRELARTLREDRYAGSAAEAPYVRQAIPGTLAGLVQGRLWRLPPSCLGLARAVAALGERSARRCAFALAGVDLAVGARAHAALAGAGLMDRDELRFTHPMMGEATLAGVVPATRSELHRRAARLLERAGAPDEEIAAQLLAAERGQDPWAVEILTRSGERALAAGDNDAALHHLRRALAECSELNAETLLALGIAEARSGDPSAHMRLEWATRMGDERTAKRAAKARAKLVN